jgi:hypothetical protein
VAEPCFHHFLHQMANNKELDVPPGHEHTAGTASYGTPEKIHFEEPDTLEQVPTNQTEAAKEAQRHNALEALDIPDWQAKEKKVVRTLDMTLLPQLWILYMFNYLNRTNIA